jgi:hypothetical protein
MPGRSFVLDWPEPLGALVSLLLAGLFGVVALVSLVQTALSRRKDSWPYLNTGRGRTETSRDDRGNQNPQKNVEDHQQDNDVPR